MMREWQRYDPLRDRDVLRLSEAGYYCEIPALEGRNMRELRAAALQAIQEARAAGLPPGEVQLPRRGRVVRAH